MPGEEPRRIQSAQELSSAGVWLTNLDDEHLHRSGLANNRFRAQDFLRVNLTSLACDLGSAVTVEGGFKQAVGPQCAQDLANVFGTVMDVVHRWGVEGFPPYQLRIGVRRASYEAPQDYGHAPDVLDALRNACQRYTSSERRHLDRHEQYQERTTIFTLHRYFHALDLLSQRVPSGSWREAPRLSPNEIDAHPRPLLLEVQVHEMSDEVGRIVNFGGSRRSSYTSGGVRQIDASPRRWMTQPEYRFLRKFGKISVNTILEADGSIENPLLPRMPYYGILQTLSPAFNLAMESFWTSAYRNERGQNDFSSIAAWMSAYDRLACLSQAMTLLKKDPDLDIAGFGFGRVIVKSLDPGAKFGAWAWRLVQGTVLIPPMAVEGAYEVPEINDRDGVQTLQAIQLSGDRDLLLSLDAKALEDYDQQLADVTASAA